MIFILKIKLYIIIKYGGTLWGQIRVKFYFAKLSNPKLTSNQRSNYYQSIRLKLHKIINTLMGRIYITLQIISSKNQGLKFKITLLKVCYVCRVE